MVDAAGRLQVPPELLESARIGDRATLELVEGGVLVKPVAGRTREGVLSALAWHSDESNPTSQTRRRWRWFKKN